MSYQSKHTGAEIDASVDTTQQILNMIYPVGSIYMSVNNVSPATFIGGTWTALTDRVLIGAGSSYAVNATGGATSHTHTSAAHTHTSAAHTHTIAAHTHGALNSKNGTLEAMIGSGNGDAYSIAFAVGNQNSTVKSIYSVRGASYSQPSTVNSHNTIIHGETASKALTSNSTTPGNTGSTTPGNTGSSSNLPPYLAVYMWKRTA